MPESLIDLARRIVVGSSPLSERLHELATCVQGRKRYRWVGLYEVTRSEVRIIACTGQELPAFPTFPVEKGLTGEAVRTRESVVVNDVLTDARYLAAFGTTRSEMIVPILDPTKSSVVGTIDVESDRPNAFTESDRLELEQLALVLAGAFSSLI